MRKSKWPELDGHLHDWLVAARASGIDVTDEVLAIEARKLALGLGIPESEFNASVGFISRFKVRHQCTSKVKAGDGRDAAENPAIGEWQRDVLPTLIEGVEPRNIYNADETALFYRLLPHRTITVRGERCQGGQKKKDRVSVLLTSNMGGSDKCVPLVIGHYAKPRCFRHVQSLPVDYQHSKNAWMTSQIFLDWLRRLNARMVEENRNIVLFLDNCSSHAKATSSANLSNITIHYLPPNSTSRTQPMDQGVIRSLKCVYRRKLLEQIVSAFDAGKDVKELLKINLKDAILLLSASWKSVTVRTISNCFRHAAFSQPDGNATANVSDVERDQSSITTSLWQQAAGALGVDAADGNLSSFVAVDDDVFTEQVLSAEDLLRERHAADEADSEESDEEEVCPRAPKPTRSQAVAGLQMVMDYLQSLPDTSSAVFSHAAAIDEFLVNRALTACTQQSIDDFFRPLPDQPKPAKNTGTSCLQQSRKWKVVQVSLHSALESKSTQKSSPCLPADKETQPAACDVLCSEDDLPTVFAPPARRRCVVILSSSSEDDRSEPERLTSKQQERQPHQSPKQVPTKGPSCTVRCAVCHVADHRVCRTCHACGKLYHHMCQVEDDDEGKRCDDCFLSLKC